MIYRNLIDAMNHSGGWKRRHGDEDVSATGEARLVPSRNRRKLGRSYNRLNREIDRRRAGGGRSVVARRRSNVCGAKRPCCGNDCVEMGGRGEMIKAPVDLQDLRRRLYVKAKAEPSWRFWGSTFMSARWKHYERLMH